MKTTTALLTLALTLTTGLTAAAQEISGSWTAESVSAIEPPEGVSLELTFDQENTATIKYTLAGNSQTWQYDYSIADNQLTLETRDAFGEPETVTYDIKFDDEGKLLLLTPKPEPVEEDTDTAEGEAETDTDAEDQTEGETDAPAETEEAAEEPAEGEAAEAETAEAEEGGEGVEAATQEDAEDEGAEEEAEEEDTREPVWVLVKA